MAVSISVVIPVYNCEAYLKECLDSVLQQTEKNIEIICVNDGSTDGSMSILQEYSKNDERIRIIDKTNGGLSSARNAGIDMAKGEYIYYIDADDTIRDDALKICQETCTRECLDVLFFDAETKYESDEDRNANPEYEGYYTRKKQYLSVMSGAELFSEMIQADEYRTSACIQFARRSFLRENNIRFVEGILYEDNIYSLSMLLRAKRVMHIPERLYHRYVHKNSIMTSVKDVSRLYHSFLVFKNILDDLEGLGYMPEIRDSIISFVQDRQQWVVNNFIILSDEQRRVAKEMMSNQNLIEFSILVESIAAELEAKQEIAGYLHEIEASRSYKLARRLSGLAKGSR